MAIPTYKAIMLPLLKATADGQEHHVRDLYELLADHFNLSPEKRKERLPSGQQTYIANRVGWARTYLVKAGLLEDPKRGVVKISPEGVKVLQQNPTHIDNKFLRQYPSFVEFIKKTAKTEGDDEPDSGSELTPDEAIESAYGNLRSSLADELLDHVKNVPPDFFEQLVLDVLLAMGYGGSFKEAATKTQATADEGIDGIINEDKLGLDTVCIQAKRWKDGSVGRKEVQAFAGSMAAYRTRKGVFITTSGFTKEAIAYVDKIEQRIILIDGQRLAELMIDYDVGVATSRTYAVKKIDSDYFAETDT